MKCYKEEALRAMDIAEKKLESKDFTSSIPQQQRQSRQPTHPTFWTVCSICSVRYEYSREVLNRFLHCQQCSRPFIAYEEDVQCTTPATNPSQQALGLKNNSPNHDVFMVGIGSQGSLHTHGSNTESYQKKSFISDVSEKPKVKRRRKHVAESSESSKSSDDDDESVQPLKWGKKSGAQCSDREAKMNDQNVLGAARKDEQKEVKQEQSFYSEEHLENANVKINVRGKETVGSSKIDEALEHSTSKSTNHPDVFVYPDAEFSDFDKDKKKECFAAGQIWAIYDSIDGIPRFYAIIKNVLSPGFKLRIAWFEPDPENDDEIKWVNEELPSACGKCKLGKTETTEDHLMFSHLIFCKKISRFTFNVYPRKGETWALFKNWDIKWYMDAESHQQYEFEFVEILSDYVEGMGVIVAYLAKLKGFVSLFSQITEGGNSSFHIPSYKLFRFSHRVPSFKMTGQERVGVPVGSHEFDPLSLPMNLEEIAVPGDLEVKVGHSPSVGVSTSSTDMLKFMKNLEGNASTAMVKLERSNSAEENKDPVDRIEDASVPSASVVEAFEIPDSMFYNFDAAERSLENFQVGQIWAFYSDEDGLPKYYGQIKEVRGKETIGSSKINEASEHSTPKSTNHSAVFVYPDAEFSDFDKDKKEECFAAGQIWAIYDSIDGMPRFYAMVKNVLSPAGFKLRITWFEPNPENDDEIKWVNEELPSACGKYKLGKTETTEDRLMFSHLIFCEKISYSTFRVYPRKGETWALFKNWDIKWHMDTESHRQYDFEFVEILSDYVEDVGVIVAYLAKLKGFASLFSRIMKGGNSSFQIPSVELFRFSHRVPSFKMTGQERVGVPAGSYELDPVSLPLNLEEIAVPDYLEVKVGHSPSVGGSTRSSDMLKFTKNLERNASAVKVKLERSNSAEENNNDPVDHIDDVSAPSTSAAEFLKIPYSMFYNFDAAERSLEKFQVGQIWAFYSDEDGLPKYYGQIKRVRTSPHVELQVTYLTNCWLPENAIRWEDKDMLISCGRFKVKPGSRPYVYNNTYYVSHQVHASTVSNKMEYEFFPRKGEIWALYRTWTTKMKRSDLKNWEYDIVEVIEERDSWMGVLLLEMVSGYNTVFKGKLNKVGSPVTMTVSRTDLLKFSHQIPAFKLTEEHGNSNLRGFWELDPVAIPIHHFSCLN